MNQPDQHVIEALNALGVGPGERFHVQKRLGDGPTNETWLVTRDRERYVVRLVKPVAAAIGLSPAEELTITTAAARQGLAPPIVASSAARGIVLSRYVDGRIWTERDVRDKAQISRLSNTLRRVHELECDARPISLELTVDRYARLSTDSRADMWADTIVTTLGRISRRDPVVCHNDVNVTNVVDDGNLTLLDWEYAALGDPLFELAVVAAHHELDDSISEHLLTSYLGHNDASAAADLKHWRAVYENLVALWQSGVGLEVAETRSVRNNESG